MVLPLFQPRPRSERNAAIAAAVVFTPLTVFDDLVILPAFICLAPLSGDAVMGLSYSLVPRLRQ